MIISVHSYRGGTGKTLLSVNLSTIYVSMGKRVCLLDLDFRAPSLCSIFKSNKYWVNDYLNRVCEINGVLTDCSPKYITKGRLFVGLANPSTVAIREMLSRDRKWEMRALVRLLSLKTSLLNDMHFDYVILDTSPGLQYSSINAIVSADLALIVMSVDKSDVEGTQRMIHNLYKLFEKKTGVIINKVPSELLSSKRNAIKLETNKLPIIGALPCSCDVLRAEGECLSAFEKIDNPFIKTLQEIATKIEHFR